MKVVLHSLFLIITILQAVCNMAKYCLEIVKSKLKLATVVEGDQKAPFSIATTPRRRGGRYSFPWIAPLYPRYLSYIAEC